MPAFRNNDYKNFIIIFFVAISIRGLLFVAVGPWDDHIAQERIISSDDAPYYHVAAIRIAQNKPINSAYSSALYQYFVAFLYSVFGYKPYIVILFQLIMGSVSCILLYKIGQNIFNEKVALLAGLLLAFEHSSILYSNRLLSETMFIFLFIIHIYLFMNFLVKKNIGTLVYSAVFLGLATHARSIGLYFLIFLLWPLFLYFKNNIRQGILSFFILTSVFFITVIPWMVRNYIVSGEFILSADQGKAKYWFAPNLMNIVDPPRINTGYKWTSEEKLQMLKEAEQPGMMSFVKVVKKYGITANQLYKWQLQFEEGTLSSDGSSKDREVYSELSGEVQYRSHGYFNTEFQPPDLPKTSRIFIAVLYDVKSLMGGMLRYLSFLDSGGYPEILGYSVHKMEHETWGKGLWATIKFTIQEKSRVELFFLCLSISVLSYLYLTMCFGIYTAIKKEEFAKIVTFVAVILYFILASSGPVAAESANPRYRVPIMPFVIIISCYGMMEIIHRFRKSTKETQLMNFTS